MRCDDSVKEISKGKYEVKITFDNDWIKKYCKRLWSLGVEDVIFGMQHLPGLRPDKQPKIEAAWYCMFMDDVTRTLMKLAEERRTIKH
jgi:hypothetical protein